MRFGTVDGRVVLVDGDRALDVAQASGGALPRTRPRPSNGGTTSSPSR